MTEQEWLVCTDLSRMLRFLEGKLGDRKLRLFACACCRRIWHLMPDCRCQKAVEINERFADREVSREEFAAVYDDVWEVYRYVEATDGPENINAVEAVESACAIGFHRITSGAEIDLTVTAQDAELIESTTRRAARAVRFNEPNRDDREAEASERAAQAVLLRDIVNPFQSGRCSLLWLTYNGEVVRRLTKSIYEGLYFKELPILADALEDAGCDNRDILDHCRGPGPHVRGCWVLDLLLGKN